MVTPGAAPSPAPGHSAAGRAALHTLWAGSSREASRGAVLPVVAATVLAALAGALVGGRAPAPAASPYALPGLALHLAVPPLVVLAAAVLYWRSQRTGRDGAWGTVSDRGGAAWISLTAAAGPAAAVALVAGLLAPLAALAVVALTGLHGRAAWGAAAAGAWQDALTVAVLLGAAAFAGAQRGMAEANLHFRVAQLPPRGGWRRRPLDAGLVVLGLFIGWTADGAVRSAVATGAVPAGILLWPAALLGAAILAMGATGLAVRAGGPLAAWGQARCRSADAVLAVRALGRGRTAARVVSAACLAATVVVFALSGLLTVAGAASVQRDAGVGADLRLTEVWPRPCGACKGSAATYMRWRLPSLTGANRGLPGVAAAATLVRADDSLEAGVAGFIPIRTYGVVPASLASVAHFAPAAAARGRRELALLARRPGAVIVSRGLAALAGVRPGQRVQTGLLGEVTVLATARSWPGIAPVHRDWMVVNWRRMAAPLQRRGAWTTAGFRATALMRLRPGASPARIAAALTGRGVHVAASARAGAGGAGAGVLPWLLWPLALLAAVLGWTAVRESLEDPSVLPDGEAAAALGAGPSVIRARRRLAWLGAGWGAACGSLVGWAASWLFWPILRVGAASLAGPPLHVPMLGLGLAAAAGIAGAVGARLAARSLPAEPADPETAARVERHAANTPEPAAAPESHGVAGRTRRPARRWSVRPGAIGASVRAIAIPASRRLAQRWPRLAGLAAGLLLAAAVAATVPLYVAGSLTRVLHAGLAPVHQRPAGALLVHYAPPPGTGAASATGAMTHLAALAPRLGASVGLTSTPVVTYLATNSGNVRARPTAGLPAPSRSYVGTMTVDSLSGLAAHVHVTQGRMYSGSGMKGGVLQAVVVPSAYRLLHLRVGRRYRLDSGGRTLEVQLVGVASQVDPTGPYWPYRYYHSAFLVAPAAFRAAVFHGQQAVLGEADWYTDLHLRGLNAEGVAGVITGLQRLGLKVASQASGAQLDISPYRTLARFERRAATLQALLRLVSVPMLAMALYFIAITAGLVVSGEETEISVLASRGAAPAQILAVYALEWLLLAIPVALVAPLPAIAFARAMGDTTGFLRFTHQAPLPVLLSRTDFIYSGVAVLLGVVAALLPVMTALGRSIVGSRLRSSRTVEWPLWQRAYLDVGALAAMAVLWWFFHRAVLQQGGQAASLVADPALFLLPAAFLVASGLVVVRVVGWLLRAADAMVGAWAAPSIVLPLRRIGRLPARFAPVLLLLCFTAALGSYSAAAARTLDHNLADGVHYTVGAPVRLSEVSPCVTMNPEFGSCLTYDRAPLGSQGARPMPPFSLHGKVPGIAAAAEVVVAPIHVSGPLGPVGANLVLIDPASFGQVGWWMHGLNPLPEATYLHTLAMQPHDVFLSPTLARLARLSPHGPLQVRNRLSGAQMTMDAAGTVRRWPGAHVSGAFAVASLPGARGALHLLVAQRIALLSLSPGAHLSAVQSGLANHAIFSSRVDVAAPEVAAALTTPEWAGQSGLLSVGFAVALAVTVVGYLLYAALLLRGQLSQLGLLRALGLPWGQLVTMVAVEQGLLLLFGAVAGTVSGLVAAALFLPLFRPAFAGAGSPPFVASGPGSATVQVLTLMAALLLVALGGMLAMLRRMHVGETVKLEE